MTHWTRRQFGLWTGAALLAPTVVVAGTPQLATAAPDGLAGIVVSAVWSKATEHIVTYSLEATNLGKKGVAIRYDLGEARLSDQAETAIGLAWLNDQHPSSRRILPPDLVDLPAAHDVAVQKSLVLGELHLTLESSKRTPELLFLVQIVVSDAKGKRSRTIDLPPLSVMKPVKQG